MEYSHFHPTNSFPAESEDFIFTSHGIYTYKLGGLPGHPGEGSHCTAWSWAQDFTGLSQPELISKRLHRPVMCVCCLQCLLWQIVLTSVLYRNRVNRMNIYDNVWQRKCNGLAYMVPGSPKMAVQKWGGVGEPHNCSVHKVGCLSIPYLVRRERPPSLREHPPPLVQLTVRSIFHHWYSLLGGPSSIFGAAYYERASSTLGASWPPSSTKDREESSRQHRRMWCASRPQVYQVANAYKASSFDQLSSLHS